MFQNKLSYKNKPYIREECVKDNLGRSVQTKMSEKIDAPKIEGLEGEFLTTSGNGGTYWSSTQKKSMPEASEKYAGTVCQYIGDDTESFKHCYFYECTENEGAYVWSRKNIQPSGGGGGSSVWGEIEGSLSNQSDLYSALNKKVEKVNCTYIVDNQSQISLKQQGEGYTCMVKENGKIYTSDGLSWDNGELGVTGILYIAEGEQYVYSDAKFYCMTTSDAETLGGQPSNYYAASSSLSSKQDIITDLSTIRANAVLGATAYQLPQNGMPSTDMDSAVQMSLSKANTAIQNHQDISGKANVSDLNTLANRVSTIDSYVPSQATSSNQLADKAFVNSSIGTNTANYISNNGNPFNSLSQLQSYSGIVTNNDYAFVTGTDEYGNTYFDRYKATVTGATVTWGKEYRLNNSTFTAEQWCAINSGITGNKITTYDGYAPQIQSKESSSNKVTLWSQFPSDTNFPSEKLVYDTIGNVEVLLEALL